MLKTIVIKQRYDFLTRISSPPGYLSFKYFFI